MYRTQDTGQARLRRKCSSVIVIVTLIAGLAIGVNSIAATAATRTGTTTGAVALKGPWANTSSTKAWNAPAGVRTAMAPAGKVIQSGKKKVAGTTSAKVEKSQTPGEKAVEVGLAQIGKPYVWAGNGPENFDCSGLTKFAWKAAGVDIPRHSTTQLDSFPAVDRKDLRPGDLVGRTGHVAIYIGDGKVVEAKEKGTDVMISPLTEDRFPRAARPG